MLGMCFSQVRKGRTWNGVGGMEGGGILCGGNGMSKGQRRERADDIQTPANAFNERADFQGSGTLTF